MTRAAVTDLAADYFDSGEFLADLGRRVAFPTESQDPGRASMLRAYLTDEMIPVLAERLGCSARVVDNPAGDFPLLVATRHEGGAISAAALIDRVNVSAKA